MIEIVKRLKEYGFTISLDDFGTGYASFSDLSSFMLDYLKLDKSLLYNLENSRTKKMIKGINDIAHNMDMEVICEGVETKEQVDSLRLLDCDIVQGYYFYQPMPYDEFEGILQSD
jgi:EAL domain-containing protein (putative c-di-GMP-specific phosphodiesterase class I)